MAWSRLTPDQIRADLDTAIEQYARCIQNVADVANPQYYNTFPPLFDNLLLRSAFNRAEMLIRMHDTPEHRKLALEIDAKYNDVKRQLFHNARIWSILKSMVTPNWKKQQSKTYLNHVTKFMAEFRDNGADLPPDQQTQFIACENELSALKRQFAANLADARAAWKFDITDHKTLDNLPPEYITEENGRRYLRHHSAAQILQICPDEKLREALWRSLQSIGQKPHDNSYIISRILSVRQKQAKLLGYASHADRIASRCSLNTAAKAAEYVRSRLRLLQPAYEKNLKLLQELKTRVTGNPQVELEPWDIPYYTFLVTAPSNKHLADINRMLTADMVLKRILDRLSGMYDITFSERSTIYLEPGSNKKPPIGTIEVWHPGVRYFEISDRNNPIRQGAIYLDLEYRDNKTGGAWSIPITCYQQTQQNIQCTVITSSDGIHALLTPSGIQNLMHELGHALQLFLNNERQWYMGFSTISDDFEEVPAMLHANLAKRHDILSSFLQPAFSTEASLAYRNSREFEAIQRQFHLLCESLLDLEIYRRGDLDPQQDLTDTEKAILSDHLYLNTKGNNLTEYLPFCQNTEIFSGPYSGLFYTYFRSEELAEYAQCRFFEETALFREIVLSAGYSKPANELYGTFMGIDPSPDAILHSLHPAPHHEDIATPPTPAKP